MISKKILLSIALVFLVAGTASAAVLSGFFTHTTHATVDEAITIDGAESWVSFFGGESSNEDIWITNRAGVDIRGELKTTYSPDGIGLTTTYMLNGVELVDTDGNGRPEIVVPADSTVVLTKCMSAASNIAGGEYTVVTEMKPVEV